MKTKALSRNSVGGTKKATQKKKSKATTDDESVTLTRSLQEAFIHFIEYHPPKRFSRNLRRMLMAYLMLEGAVEAVYLNNLLYDLEGLFEVLDGVEGRGVDNLEFGFLEKNF